MENKKLIDLVAAEVLRRLEQLNGRAVSPVRQALAIFTGGTIGLETGLEELKLLQAINIELTVVLSAFAETTVGSSRIKEKLGSGVQVVTAQSPYPGKNLRAADIVLVPVLTQNTAAKLAHTFTDTMAASLIVQALMLGKPVIAAQNAADPEDAWRLQKRMDQAPPPLRAAMQENLRKCKLYGIELVPVDTLAAAAKKVIFREADPQPVFSPGKTAKKQVLDADTVRHSARNGARTVSIAHGALVTPLARDIAGECGVDIVYK